MSENWENKKREKRPERWPRSIFGPLLLITIGVVLLLDTLGMTGGSFWDIFVRFWPVLFIASGLDSVYRREGVASGVFFGGLGVVFLLSNLGYLRIDGWEAIFRLWPVLLVLWGFDVIFGRRSIWSLLGGIVIGLAILGAVSWLIVSPPSGAQGIVSHSIMQPLQDGIDEASISIEQTSGSLNIASGAEPSVLVAGTIDLDRNEEPYENLKKNGNEAVYELNSGNNLGQSFLQVGTLDRMDWDLKLNRQVPLELNTQLIMGEQKVNLSGVQVLNHENETIFGESVLILPAEGDFDVSMRVVFGEIKVYVLENTPLRVNLDTAFTSIHYPADYERQEDEILSPAAETADDVIDLFINVPFGSVTITYLER